MVPPRVTSLAAYKSELQNKKKGKKGNKGNRLSDLAVVAAESLKTHGWAVVDNFAGLETVEKVRMEIRQLEAQYEKGEIWVGKEADIGAQIAVSSVRGDKVLWVDKDGLHNGPFSAFRELTKSIDKFVVKELGSRVHRLRNATERSDPMLAIYPG